jgi:hypothetical protein
MLDKPEKTRELVDVLTAALPFEVELPPHVVAHRICARKRSPTALSLGKPSRRYHTPATRVALSAISFPRKRTTS